MLIFGGECAIRKEHKIFAVPMTKAEEAEMFAQQVINAAARITESCPECPLTCDWKIVAAKSPVEAAQFLRTLYKTYTSHTNS